MSTSRQSPKLQDSSTPESLGERVQALRIPKQADPGPPLAGRLPWLLCLILACTTGWFAYLAFVPPSETPSEATDGRAAEAVADGNPVDTPSIAADTIVLESKGYIIPTQQILVSPQISGRLIALHIEEGQKVEAGEILAEIERTEYEADYKRSLASLKRATQHLLELERGNRPEEIAQAKKELEEAQEQLVQLSDEHQRNEELLRSNTLAEREYEQSRSAYKAMQRRVERLQFKLQLLEKGPREEQVEIAGAEVDQSQADVDKSAWRLHNCTIRAPISGTILQKNAEEGNIVNPIAFNGSFSLCDMADLSNLEVELDIQERDVSRVFKGQVCQVRAEAFPQRVYAGVVSRLMPIADRAKGAVPVRVKLSIPAEEEGIYLKPEMGATVTFFGEPTAQQ